MFTRTVEVLHYMVDNYVLVETIPGTALPATVVLENDTYKVCNTSKSNDTITPPITLVENFTAFAAQKCAWEKYIATGITTTGKINEVINSIVTDKITCVSDGSCKHGRGVYGIIMYTEDGRELATCTGMTFGSKQSSYCSKLFGLVATLTIIGLACEYTNCVSDILIDHYLDNKGVVDKIGHITNIAYKRMESEKEWDAIEEISQLLNKHKIKLKIHHVLGHQDEKKQGSALSLKEKMNVWADKLAMETICRYGPSENISKFPGSYCQLIVNQAAITKDVKHTLQTAYSINKIRGYIERKYEWTDTAWENINWAARGNTIKSMKDNKFITQYIYDKLPVGHEQRKTQGEYDETCKLCHLKKKQWSTSYSVPIVTINNGNQIRYGKSGNSVQSLIWIQFWRI